MRYFWNAIWSKAYWEYVLLSRQGIELILAIYGALYLFVESLDFFQIYTQDKYAPYAFLIFLAVSILLSFLIRRPIKSITVEFPKMDINVEVRIANLFDVSGATMISTNTNFEADVAGGKISPDSLQGQFTSRYFTGNQKELIDKISTELRKKKGKAPHPMGTTISITTHGKTFYLTAMSELNEQGNASTTLDKVGQALEGLWSHVREAGELQELAVPVIGTGRGRLKTSRKKTISFIAESFIKASEKSKFTDRLVIVVRPEDAESFGVNLYDIKDHLSQVLHS